MKQLNDTTQAVLDFKYDKLSGMSKSDKFDRLLNLIDTTRELVKAGIRNRYPDCDPVEFKKRLAAMLLGRDFTIAF